MSNTVIIHTESVEKLIRCFQYIDSRFERSRLVLRLNCKNYIPWEIDSVKSVIISFGEYMAIPTGLDPVSSTLQMVNSSQTDNLIIIDESADLFEDNTKGILCIGKKEILKLNLDSKYYSVKWFLADLHTQIDEAYKASIDESNDTIRYLNKISSPIFKKRIIYIDGGLGDHVMALPLLKRLSRESYICCKYKFVYEHLETLGFIDWNDDLFGGYKRYVYEYGSANNSSYIIDAFFEMYGETRSPEDILKYTGPRIINPEYDNLKKIALVCTSAAKINGQDSNKDWSDIRWFKLINHLKKSGYYIIQVGSINDNQIPNVDSKFLDKDISNLASLIGTCSLWLSVDTFFHHFASAIKPEAGICLTPFYNDHAKHTKVTYLEKNCGKDFSDRRWWLDLQQPERKECMELIEVENVISAINDIENKNRNPFVEFIIPTFSILED